MIKRSAGVLASSVVLVAGLAALSPLAAAAVAEPRRIPDQPGFYQRILVKPDERDASDARLLAEPNDKAAVKQASIPLFTVLYVYDCKPTDCTQWLEAGAPPDSTQWIEVGAKADGTTDGWIKATHAQDWRSMLAMQFAPRGQRSRAAMFQDLFDLEKLVTANDGAKQARELSSRIETGKADPRVVAAEPKEAVNPHNAFYLLPILRWKTAEFADGTPTHLLEIAGVNHKRVPPPLTPKPKVGVVFVLETSHSMGPYLERTKQSSIAIVRSRRTDPPTASASG